MTDSTLCAPDLIVAVASSALFDLTDADRVFREHGQAACRAHQPKGLSGNKSYVITGLGETV
jgi:hypothetical protein